MEGFTDEYKMRKPPGSEVVYLDGVRKDVCSRTKY